MRMIITLARILKIKQKVYQSDEHLLAEIMYEIQRLQEIEAQYEMLKSNTIAHQEQLV